jgi:hypothetical protein
LSRRSNFISKEDKKEKLLKERANSLEYNKEIATIYKVIEDPAIEQKIQKAYKGDAGVQIAKA